VTWLMQTRPWDLVASSSRRPTRRSHESGTARPQHPRHDAEMAAQVKEDILAYFQAMDACVGQLVQAAGPEATVIVMSDHGGGPFEKFFHVNNWLASQGFLKFKRTAAQLGQAGAVCGRFTPITAPQIVNLLRLGRLRQERQARAPGAGWMGKLFLSLRDVDWSARRRFPSATLDRFTSILERPPARHRRADAEY